MRLGAALCSLSGVSINDQQSFLRPWRRDVLDTDQDFVFTIDPIGNDIEVPLKPIRFSNRKLFSR